MSWIWLSDNYIDHPKFLALSDAGFRLWHEGMAYCRRHETDGIITNLALEGFRSSHSPRVVKELTASLWDVRVDGYLVHDYLDWNLSKAELTRKRKEGKERARNWRERHVTNIDRNGVTNSVTNDVRNIKNTDVTLGREIDLRYSEGESEGKPEERRILSPQGRSEFDRVYGVYPNKDRKEQANRAWVELWPSHHLAGTIYADIVRRMQAGWVKLERRFIPHLATYLRDRMWEDEVGVEPIDADDAERMKMTYAWTCQTCGEIHELVGGAVIRERTKKPLPCQKQSSPVMP